MLPAKDVTRLWHMLEAAKLVIGFAKDRTAQELVRDHQFGFAVQHGLEIIGEAPAQVSAETRQQFPSLEWQDVVGMRNRIVHVYFDVDSKIVWQTITRDLPALVQLLEQALEEYPPEPSVWDEQP